MVSVVVAFVLHTHTVGLHDVFVCDSCSGLLCFTYTLSYTASYTVSLTVGTLNRHHHCLDSVLEVLSERERLLNPVCIQSLDSKVYSKPWSKRHFWSAFSWSGLQEESSFFFYFTNIVGSHYERLPLGIHPSVLDPVPTTSRLTRILRSFSNNNKW